MRALRRRGWRRELPGRREEEKRNIGGLLAVGYVVENGLCDRWMCETRYFGSFVMGMFRSRWERVGSISEVGEYHGKWQTGIPTKQST